MSNAVLQTFKSLYANSSSLSRAQLETIYEPDIIFKDPIHRIEGLDALSDYMQTMYANVEECSFNYLDEIVAEDRAVVKWDMDFRHKRLRGGKPITVRGVTIVEFRDLIYSHEDIFDLGSMIYENVPVVGMQVRYLKQRLEAA
jgi:hypothetical protein